MPAAKSLFDSYLTAKQMFPKLFKKENLYVNVTTIDYMLFGWCIKRPSSYSLSLEQYRDAVKWINHNQFRELTKFKR